MVTTILIVLAMADLLMWGIANGSGHKIPDETNNTFLISFLVLVFLIVIVVWLKDFLTNQRKRT